MKGSGARTKCMGVEPFYRRAHGERVMGQVGEQLDGRGRAWRVCGGRVQQGRAVVVQLGHSCIIVCSAWPLLSRKGECDKAHAVESVCQRTASTHALGGGLVDSLPSHNTSRCSEVRCTPLGTEQLGFGITAAHQQRSEAHAGSGVRRPHDCTRKDVMAPGDRCTGRYHGGVA
jgi:hypothetical protein